MISQEYSSYPTGRAQRGVERVGRGREPRGDHVGTAVVSHVMHLVRRWGDVVLWLQFGCLQKAGCAVQGVRGSDPETHAWAWVGCSAWQPQLSSGGNLPSGCARAKAQGGRQPCPRSHTATEHSGGLSPSPQLLSRSLQPWLQAISQVA